MEEKAVVEVSENELAALLESMPDNMVITVSFGEAENDGERV
jgi:hypothetical protein